MIIYPKDYTEIPSTKRELTQEEKDTIKTEIKAYVVEPKQYRDVIDYVQKALYIVNIHVLDEEVAKLVKEVDDEWHPPEPTLIEETPEEPVVLKSK
jgi:hypothetical protein